MEGSTSGTLQELPVKEGKINVQAVLSTKCQSAKCQSAIAEVIERIRSDCRGKKESYFVAVQAGMDKNYQPMEKLFAEIIERSVASS